MITVEFTEYEMETLYNLISKNDDGTTFDGDPLVDVARKLREAMKKGEASAPPSSSFTSRYEE